MARSIDSDYIDFSHMGGFDMGIDFNGFEENVKKFMELPIKYLDSAHDKAVEFIEDVHAIFYGPFTDHEVPNNDQSNCYVITESSPTSIEKELVGPNIEPSTPASFITMENSSTGCDTDQTESFSTKSTGLSLMNHVYPENNSSEGAHIESNDQCILPENISTTRIYDSSEEVILWNPVTSVKPQRSHELTTIPQDDHALHALETEETEQVGFNCCGHSGTCISHDSSTSVSSCADDPSMLTDNMVNFVDVDLRHGQKHMKNDKIEVYPVHQRENASFKKMFLRNLSRKLRWSKKQADTNQAMTFGSQDAENLGRYQLVSSSDDLEDGWEVL
ncbi:uncharacterized protein LOC8079507 isoform X3 [Sorghum bicolor]|uniref:Uncharacterized protein n=1 Tax=Sorghum bicolor TaxID=4558 RepID=A0A1W0VVJ3_SORBI|nr:uncharacterized protein LOC8079507 isoform X3 [Sorghum bicolor]OQU86115.1 hypothetical protein SORBI_3003G021100 [Sorghum bicolor]OQU86116.1 hypothetical protein SORBI_3003G021100 [Sorghum bicolor]|eukprot:XP_021310850.1 uncharacterized protein LOC8079507 isoform X3 [Sorghum bicolor]